MMIIFSSRNIRIALSLKHLFLKKLLFGITQENSTLEDGSKVRMGMVRKMGMVLMVMW